uniref:DDE Tnp4 domain-containing protein n=1 Tax=Dicentrarchus labrax TaxID=13489 RepID=A0A8C4EEK2_DICLA
CDEQVNRYGLSYERNRTKWVKSWISQREAQGAFPNLCREMDEPDDFKNVAWLFPAQFHMLEDLVRPNIQRCNTNYFKSLGFLFRLGVSTIRQIIPETCNAIYQVLREKYLKVYTAHEWQQVSSGFMSQWNFPNCLGALDGKHINSRPPPGTGSTYYNYKHNFSIVLIALVDSSYRFLYVNVGCNGRISDGVSVSWISDQLSPYCVVADEVFPLTDYLLKPNRRLTVEQRIFNYRLSRAQRVVENAFGIMANRFRVLLTTIDIRDTVTVEYIVLACCALHNFLRSEGSDAYMADIVDQEGPEIIEGRWRQDPALQQAPLPQTTNAAARAKQIRDELCRYFMSDTGAVPFQ